MLSIFVNPTQFGPNEDLARYPRDLDGDLAKAAAAGTDVVFVPDAADMYPPGFQTSVEVRELTQRAVRRPFRPGHFAGVATVVAKLFNIVRPDVALFGEKDYQQLAVIRRMVRRPRHAGSRSSACPTVREPDGLAHVVAQRLPVARGARARAVAVARAVRGARPRGRRGSATPRRSSPARARAARRRSPRLPRAASTPTTLAPVDAPSTAPAVMAVAAFVGRTRLIDNVRLV